MAMKHSPGFERLCDEARAKIKQVDVQQAHALARDPRHLLIDVREESEWRGGHATGAIHLSKGIIERDIEARVPDKTTKLLCYCGGGFRSALVAENLQRMGYSEAYSVAGGWRAWCEAGLPTTRD